MISFSIPLSNQNGRHGKIQTDEGDVGMSIFFSGQFHYSGKEMDDNEQKRKRVPGK